MDRAKMIFPKLVISTDGVTRRIFVPEIPYGCGSCRVKMSEGDPVYFVRENRKIYCEGCARGSKVFLNHLMSPSRPEIEFWSGSLQKHKEGG